MITETQKSEQVETATGSSQDLPLRENGLPSPADQPDSIVLIYDGNCVFCTKSVKQLAKFDGSKRLAFVSLHHPFVAENYPELTHEMLMKQLYAVDQKGNYYGGAAAIRFLSRKLPLLWIIAPVMHIPFSLPLWQWAYMQIANRRYKLAKKRGVVCDGEACEIHFGDK